MAESPQPASQTTFAVYVGPPLETIRSIVASQFHVKDAFLDPYGVPTIQVTAEPVKAKFKVLLGQLAEHHLVGAIRGTGDTLTVRVFQKPPVRAPRRIINLVLFIATLASVFAAGYLIWDFFGPVISPAANPYAKGAEFAVGLMAIIGLHEFGHQYAARHHKLDATLPYFIPGPPPIVPFGTFGAVISLREPPANRDQLFDLGLSGPVVGFFVTILVGVVAVALGLPLTPNQVTALENQGVSFVSWPNIPALFVLLSGFTGLLRPDIGPNLALYSQFDYAAQIGALLTFLNIIPAWQLDGGHISRATFGQEGHRIATILGVIALFATGYPTFAVLLLIFMGFSGRGITAVQPLDDISPISNSRKILYLLALVMLGLTFSLGPSRLF